LFSDNLRRQVNALANALLLNTKKERCVRYKSY